MKNKVICVVLAISLLTVGCGTTAVEPADTDSSAQPSDAEQSVSEQVTTDVDAKEADASGADAYALVNTSLLSDEEEMYYDTSIVPSVEPYSVRSDFSNVVYDDYFEYYFDLANHSEYNNVKGLRDALVRNNFAVVNVGGNEFFDVYESNRYSQFPSFITVDSLMHTYHLYFAYLMEKTEKEYLADTLQSLSASMLEKTASQYRELFGTDWENAALCNLEFFYIKTAVFLRRSIWQSLMML